MPDLRDEANRRRERHLWKMLDVHPAAAADCAAIG
jgi:hypothetical protein